MSQTLLQSQRICALTFGDGFFLFLTAIGCGSPYISRSMTREINKFASISFQRIFYWRDILSTELEREKGIYLHWRETINSLLTLGYGV